MPEYCYYHRHQCERKPNEFIEMNLNFEYLYSPSALVSHYIIVCLRSATHKFNIECHRTFCVALLLRARARTPGVDRFTRNFILTQHVKRNFQFILPHKIINQFCHTLFAFNAMYAVHCDR